MTEKDARTLPVSRQFPAREIRVAHESGPLVVRPILMTDLAEIERGFHASLPELLPFMPWAHAPRELTTELQRLRSNEADYFAGREMVMGLFRGHEMLSMVGLHPRVALNPSGLEIGYWAPTPHTGKGWTTLGVRILVCYAFDRLGCTRLQVMCDEANPASQRVIEKSGFAFETVMRNLISSPPPELVAKGYRATGRTRMYALFPDTAAALPWLGELRSCLTYVNLLGHVLP